METANAPSNPVTLDATPKVVDPLELEAERFIAETPTLKSYNGVPHLKVACVFGCKKALEHVKARLPFAQVSALRDFAFEHKEVRTMDFLQQRQSTEVVGIAYSITYAIKNLASRIWSQSDGM
jgi:hypothetical protein